MNGKSKVRKIIGSGTFLLCMIVAVLFAAFYMNSNAETGGIQYVQREVGAEEVPTMDKYLFAGWYSEENDTKPIETPVTGETYYAKFVPADVLGIKAQVSGTLLENSELESTAIRFVTTIDSLQYQKIGFVLRKGTGNEVEANVTNMVYEKLYQVSDDEGAVGEISTVEPTMFDATSKYFKTYTIRKVPGTEYNTDITVTPYWITLDGTKVIGTKAIKTVNFQRSWVYVDTNANTDANECGTYSHPYTTLDAALMTVNACELNKGKVTLLSDITVNRALEIKANTQKEITIQSEDGNNRKQITSSVNDSSTGLFDVKGKLILKDLDITGGHNAIRNHAGSIVSAENVHISNVEGNGIYHGGGTFTGKNILIDTVIKNGVYINAGEVTLDAATIQNVIGGDEYIEEGETKYRKRDGVYCDGGKLTVVNGITIQNLTAEHSRNGIHMSTGTLDADEVIIRNVNGQGIYADQKKDDSWLGIFRPDYPASVLTVDDLTITGAKEEGLVVEDNATATVGKLNISETTRGIYMLDAATLTINDVGVIQDTSLQGVYLLSKANITMNAKLTVKKSGSQGIYLQDEAQATIHGLEVSETNSQGMLLKNSAHATVSDFVITGSATGTGLRCMNASTVTAANGTIHAGSEYGVYLDGSSKVTATNVNVDRSESNEKALVVICKGSTFTLNEEGGTSSIDGKKDSNVTGRGVEVQGTFNLNGGSITNHQMAPDVDTNGTVVSASKKDGAAVYVVADGTFNMNGGIISNNQATNAGAAVAINGVKKDATEDTPAQKAAVFNMNGGTISGNTAVYGAVMARNGIFNMSDGTITDNTATNAGGGVIVSTGTFNLSGGTISGNTSATSGAGVYMNGGGRINFTENGTGTITGNTAGSAGGGVHISAGALTMKSGEISGNTATTHGGGIAATGSGAVTVSGGTITNNTATTYGGGLSLNSSGTITLSGSGSINNNTAQNTKKQQNGGGGVYLAKGTFNMSGGTIAGNTAKTSGGGVTVSKGTFEMTGGEISGNTAVTGGGLFMNNAAGTINLKGGTVTGNTATHTYNKTTNPYRYGGGGISIEAGECTVEGSAVISANNSKNDGGGVSVRGGVFVLNGGSISGNTATAGGGGISVNGSGAAIVIEGGAISGNTGQNGHGMMIRACEAATMTGGEIRSNINTKTAGNGGGIYLFSGVTFDMTGGTITDNTANDGGAIYAPSGSNINFGGGTIADNHSSNATKKGIYGSGTLTYTANVTIADTIGASINVVPFN